MNNTCLAKDKNAKINTNLQIKSQFKNIFILFIFSLFLYMCYFVFFRKKIIRFLLNKN